MCIRDRDKEKEVIEEEAQEMCIRDRFVYRFDQKILGTFEFPVLKKGDSKLFDNLSVTRWQ